MAIKWFESSVEAKPDFQIRGNTIILTGDALEKLAELNKEFGNVEAVKLGFDEERGWIAVAPAKISDRFGFKITKRGRGGWKQIAAERLFAEFGLPSADGAEGSIIKEGDVIFLSISTAAPTTPKRRNKRSKGETAE